MNVPDYLEQRHLAATLFAMAWRAEAAAVLAMNGESLTLYPVYIARAEECERQAAHLSSLPR